MALGRQQSTIVITARAASPSTPREPLARHVGHDLEWAQKSWHESEWTLRAGDSALIRIIRQHWWSGRVDGEIGGESVVYGPSLFCETAERARDRLEIARLHRTGWRLDEDSERFGLSRWRGVGRIEYGPGHRAWLRRESSSARWTLLDPRGREIAVMARLPRAFRIEGTLRLGLIAADTPALELLVTFAWWLVLRETSQSQAR